MHTYDCTSPHPTVTEHPPMEGLGTQQTLSLVRTVTAYRLHMYVRTYIRTYMQPPEQHCRGHCYIRPWGYWALKVVEGRSRKKIRVEKDLQIKMSWTMIY